jgi:universal stress protein E
MAKDDVLLRNIFVILDQQKEEQPALDRARLLARTTGASLHLFICAYDLAVGIATFFSRSEKGRFIRTIVDGNKALVERLTQGFEAEGIALTTEVVWDRRPAEAMMKSINGSKADLVVKRARSQNQVKEAIFSHVDRHILRCSPCPVLLVKSREPKESRLLLAAVNSAPEDSAHEKLNELILRTSRHLADSLGFEMHLVSAYPAPPAHFPPSLEGETPANYRKKMSQMVNKNVGSFAKEYAVTSEHVHCIEGPVDWAIPMVSDKISADFVVIVTVARQRVDGLALGNTAEHILDELDCDVLVLKSEQADQAK